METSRRELAAMIALGSAGAALSPALAEGATAGSPSLIHHVFFWLKNSGSEEDRDRLIAGLRGLRAIPVIRDLKIGVPARTEERSVVDASYDVSELMYFNNATEQKFYQDHPVHQAFVRECEHLWRKVTVYDMQVIP